MQIAFNSIDTSASRKDGMNFTARKVNGWLNVPAIHTDQA